MRDDVYFCLMLTLLAGPLARVATRWLHPRPATVFMTVTAVVLAAVTWASLGIMTLGALARHDIGSEHGHVADRASLLGRLTEPDFAPVAVVVLLLAAVASAAFVIRRGRAFAVSFAHANSFEGRERVVVTADRSADAYAVPGRPGRVVVSAGMLRALDTVDVDVLLAHEHAHLNHGHHVYVTLVRLASATNPFLRPLARATEFQIERWADELAAAGEATRHQVATTISKAAVATSQTPPAARPRLVLGIGPYNPGALRSAGPVPRRVAALLHPAPLTNPLAIAAFAVILAIATAVAIEAGSDLAELLATVPDALI